MRDPGDPVDLGVHQVEVAERERGVRAPDVRPHLRERQAERGGALDRAGAELEPLRGRRRAQEDQRPRPEGVEQRAVVVALLGQLERAEGVPVDVVGGAGLGGDVRELRVQPGAEVDRQERRPQREPGQALVEGRGGRVLDADDDEPGGRHQVVAPGLHRDARGAVAARDALGHPAGAELRLGELEQDLGPDRRAGAAAIRGVDGGRQPARGVVLGEARLRGRRGPAGGGRRGEERLGGRARRGPVPRGVAGERGVGLGPGLEPGGGAAVEPRPS